MCRPSPNHGMYSWRYVTFQQIYCTITHFGISSRSPNLWLWQVIGSESVSVQIVFQIWPWNLWWPMILTSFIPKLVTFDLDKLHTKAGDLWPWQASYQSWWPLTLISFIPKLVTFDQLHTDLVTFDHDKLHISFIPKLVTFDLDLCHPFEVASPTCISKCCPFMSRQTFFQVFKYHIWWPWPLTLGYITPKLHKLRTLPIHLLYQ